MTPYYSDDHVTLYQGDCRVILPALAASIWADSVITDPPYGETSLAWDKWPDGWPSLIERVTRSLWCFGSMRMFTNRWREFEGWRIAQDVVWEKHNGTGFAADRFKRVHELALHLYRGNWSDIHHDAVREPGGDGKKSVRRNPPPNHTGTIGAYNYVDDGMRLVRSVIRQRSVRGGLHPTEKPQAILDPLIRYSVPAGGMVLDPFCGSGSTLVAAKMLGRKAIGVEFEERYCEIAARRLAQDALPFGGAS